MDQINISVDVLELRFCLLNHRRFYPISMELIGSGSKYHLLMNFGFIQTFIRARIPAFIIN